MVAYAALQVNNSDPMTVDGGRLQPIKEDGRPVESITATVPAHLSSALVTEEDEEDLLNDEYGVLPPLHDVKQSKWSLRRPLPISVGANHRSTKLRSYSEASASHPLFSSNAPFSPTESTFSTSPPSSPTFIERGRSSSHSSHHSHSPSPPPGAHATFTPPDPYRDITRLRLTARGNHVLYPGASFAGTQQSGRSNYQVDVTVLDVNLSASTLCGYLRIKGLTDDYPELTTYFDAEIIGERFGFLTGDRPEHYSATENEDMTHWGRFPAFRHLKSELRRPNLTISERHRERKGVVFMRWKERFLVPDWKVKDINGASFAGFYYVCVQYSPHGSRSSPSVDVDDADDFPSLSSPTHSSCRSTNNHNSGPATMTGFYYHPDSEPYQQLSLTHIPEEATPVFEFR